MGDGIPVKAEHLFMKLQAMLDNLVCGTRRPQDGCGARYEPGIGENALWQAKQRAHQSFSKILTSLFSRQLRLHLLFEKTALWFSYIHPGLEDHFDSGTMRTEQNRPVSHLARVCLCLLPGLFSQEKNGSGDGGKGDPTIISKAIVTLL
jgi:hypothetical protein